MHIEYEARFRRGAGRPGHHGRGRPPWAGGGQHSDPPASAADVQAWLAGRLPDGWFVGGHEVTVDRDEITIVGILPPPGADGPAAASGRIARFREETREQRMEIAREAEARYGRSLAWGATVGQTTEMFTNLSVPVMTRLRQPERRVLDTLVDAGVARSRSDALAWCVKLVGQHQEDWIAALRDALIGVEAARQRGPEVT
jgi:hypothetical protein